MRRIFFLLCLRGVKIVFERVFEMGLQQIFFDTNFYNAEEYGWKRNPKKRTFPGKWSLFLENGPVSRGKISTADPKLGITRFGAIFRSRATIRRVNRANIKYFDNRMRLTRFMGGTKTLNSPLWTGRENGPKFPGFLGVLCLDLYQRNSGST